MQKITPFLWFDDNAEEAMKFYASIFPDAKVASTMPGPNNTVMGGTFAIGHHEFMTLNGGPQYKFNPSISLFVSCESEAEIDRLWAKLSEGGEALMPLGEYPFSQKYGWTSDKYGLNWQLMLAPGDFAVTPLFMFAGAQQGNAGKAMEHYTAIFPNSDIETMSRYEDGESGPTGQIKHAVFKLHGQIFMAMDSGVEHDITFNEAVSLYVNCEDQAEVDELWNKLLADGGEESRCGWLKDKYGVSWQIIPKALGEMFGDPDREKAGRAMQAMMQMNKIDIAGLKSAFEGK